MTFHAAPPKHTPTNTLPTFQAKDLTEGGDLAQIVLNDYGSNAVHSKLRASDFN
jgi:hypothetical protein